MNTPALKRQAAQAALGEVRNGMRIGIGTGSTAEEFIVLLADQVREGLEVVGVPTSEKTARMCRRHSIALTDLEKTPQLDLTIDGADEIDPALTLIKGGGGALLREKIVAAASDRMVVIADDSKCVEVLGRFPLPIEVNRFGLKATLRAIDRVAEKLQVSGPATLRMTGDAPFVTDGGHYIVDASYGRIPDPETLSKALHGIPGVVEHGLFIGLASRAFIAGSAGLTTLNR